MIRGTGHEQYALRECPFFHGMSARLVALLEEEVSFRAYDPRQVIYFPTDTCDLVYWVHTGRVKVNRVADQGRSLTYRHAVAGDVLGEECLVEKRCYLDYAEAMVPTVLVLIRSQDFRRLSREEAELCHAVAQALCRRTMDLEQVLAETVFVPVRHRIALALLRLYRQEDVPTDGTLKVTHQEVANMAGTTRETATGGLHWLREEALIRLANRRIVVLDPDGLEAVTGKG